MALALLFKRNDATNHGDGTIRMGLEVLRVRTTISDARMAGMEMKEFMGSQDFPEGLSEYCVHQNNAHPNEVMLVLRWDKSMTKSECSDLANFLAYSMKRHGLVDLSAWRSL